MMEDAGKAKIVEVNARSFTDEPTDAHTWTLPSDTEFEIEYETQTSGSVMGWPFGEMDGKFYLGAWVSEESPEQPSAIAPR
jgi:hypothetical protein